MSGRKSRTKGRAGEQRVVRLYNEHLPGIEARRCWQAHGGHNQPDVLAGPYSIEVKTAQVINVRKAMQQARHGARPGQWAVVHAHWTRGEKLVVLDEQDWMEIIGQWWLTAAK